MKSPAVIVLLLFPVLVQSQIRIESVIEAAGRGNREAFIDTLLASGFVPYTQPQQEGYIPYDHYAFGLDSASNTAGIWVRISRGRYCDVTIQSDGHSIHTSLMNRIRETCSYQEMILISTDGTYATTYRHPSGCTVEIYRLGQTDYIGFYPPPDKMLLNYPRSERPE